MDLISNSLFGSLPIRIIDTSGLAPKANEIRDAKSKIVSIKLYL